MGHQNCEQTCCEQTGRLLLLQILRTSHPQILKSHELALFKNLGEGLQQNLAHKLVSVSQKDEENF